MKKKRTSSPVQNLTKVPHNKTKNYILKEGIPVPFLVELGVMTKEGKIHNQKYDKFRQINRFLEFVDDILPEILKPVSSKEELVERIYKYFDEVNETPVVYHWKYRMDEL